MVALDAERVVRLSFGADKLPACAGSAAHIGRDVLARDVTLLEQRNRHWDFVGLLELIAAAYGQGAGVFWP